MKQTVSYLAAIAAFTMWGFGGSSANAATLIRDYEFQGNLNDSLGGPALVANGGTVNSNNYTFNVAQSLSLINWVSAPGDDGNYTLDLSFMFTDFASSYQRIIDMKSPASDAGLYRNNGGVLRWYPEPGGPMGVYLLDAYYRIVLTRDGTSKLVAGYLDGVMQFSFTDSTDAAVFTGPNDIMTLFKDDGGEDGAGEINQFRIYSGAMTSLEVAALGGPKAIPEPSAALLGILGLLGSCFRRVRR